MTSLDRPDPDRSSYFTIVLLLDQGHAELFDQTIGIDHRRRRGESPSERTPPTGGFTLMPAPEGGWTTLPTRSAAGSPRPGPCWSRPRRIDRLRYQSRQSLRQIGSDLVIFGQAVPISESDPGGCG